MSDAAAALGVDHLSPENPLAEAEVVTPHIPNGPGTRHLISDAEFARMKPGAVLVDTARGGVIDATALVRALDAGCLGGAGLEVLPEECLIRSEAQIFRSDPLLDSERLRGLLEGRALLHFPDVVVTPHNAYYTEGALRRIRETTLGNVEVFARRGSRNLVSYSGTPA
ncbi:D-isomer specific 2-hydroxyacid dehydrogenase, NAD binding domain [Roseomonas rosea]|jgi:D-lactate dehydrogenase|nr:MULTISPECIES: NAD(P)-dependent oxidoreductase [Acetobacteraceae]SHK32941.1 D-isomer specific 2-hydroxyacid dehydrogenase, NAD binding domain [Roseomonas rosea]